MTPSLPEFRFDLNDFPVEQRFPIWCQTLSALFEVTPLPGSDLARFTARGMRWNLGPIVVSDGQVSGHRMTRSSQQSLRDGVDRYAVVTVSRGSWKGDFGAGPQTIKSGALYLLDFARPFQVEATDNAYLMVHMSREVLEDLLPPGFEGHGAPLSGVGSKLLYEHLVTLVRHLPELSPAEALHLAHATCDMIAACLVPAADAAGVNRSVERALLHRAKRHIDRNLHNVSLSHDELCEVLGISRSALYRVFKPLGGVVEYIQRRRLDRIHQLLLSAQEHRKLSEIASQFGFVNLPHFSRAFRREFGYSATEARANGRRGQDTPQANMAESYHSWLQKHDS